MKILVFLLLLSFLVGYGVRFLNKERVNPRGNNTLQRFKRKFKNRNILKSRLADEFSNNLMNDPNKNIKLEKWDKEEDLREKADIHRTRLQKYGKSRLNGELLFMEKKGEVFKVGHSGEKEYI